MSHFTAEHWTHQRISQSRLFNRFHSSMPKILCNLSNISDSCFSESVLASVYWELMELKPVRETLWTYTYVSPFLFWMCLLLRVLTWSSLPHLDTWLSCPHTLSRTRQPWNHTVYPPHQPGGVKSRSLLSNIQRCTTPSFYFQMINANEQRLYVTALLYNAWRESKSALTLNTSWERIPLSHLSSAVRFCSCE